MLWIRYQTGDLNSVFYPNGQIPQLGWLIAPRVRVDLVLSEEGTCVVGSCVMYQWGGICNIIPVLVSRSPLRYQEGSST